ncbi:MAG: PAS domain S-box protein, partial [Burkholderiaceae bacterium]
MRARLTPTDSVLLAFDPLARAKEGRFNLSRYAHLLAILLLAVAIAGLAYLLINEDRAIKRDALTRDVDTVVQSLSLRLQTITEATTSIGLEIGDAKYNEGRFASTGRELMMSKPELLHLAYVDSQNRVRWSVQSSSPLADWARPAASEIGVEVTRSVIKRARETHATFFSPPYEDESRPSSDHGSPFTDLIAPIFSDDRYVGALLARVSLPELLRQTVKPELGQRYRIALRDDDGTVLAASTSSEVPADEPRYAARVPLLSDGIMVQASPFRQRSPVLGNALSWLVVGLTLVVMATLAALARRDVKQAQVERVLRTETAFRRAMEDSLATGMGVIDRNGVLRHVNQAFVQMTGWSVEELIGKSPPFPYWPRERCEEYLAKLAIVLAGKAPASG